MAPTRSNTADKNIVDRTKARRNADVARTVRETRDRLSQQPGNPAFDREMIKLHARALTSSAIVLPFLAVVVALAGLFAGMGPIVVLWAATTAAAYAGLSYYAQKISRTEAGDIEVSEVRLWFLASHVVTGLCWVWFSGMGCSDCQIDQFPIIKAAILLLAIAATAILAYALRGAMEATFAMPVAAYVILASHLWLPVEAVMAALLTASLPFFSYVSSHLHRSAVMLLSFRTEKDGLIAELETANAISDEARRRRFWREVQALQRLDHPGVVRVVDAGEHQGRCYLAMEFVDGETLEERLHRGGPLSPGQAAELGRQLAKATHAAHEAGIVHRDLKPANVLFDRGGSRRWRTSGWRGRWIPRRAG